MAKPISILDTDLYKLTMQQAVMRVYPTAKGTFRFTNRSQNMMFTKECLEIFQQAVAKLAELKLTPEEKQWLRKTCNYLQDDYLDYLESYRFKPEQVVIKFIPSKEDPERGQIDMEAVGPYLETILWEIPLMSLLSETYFLTVDTDWRKDDQKELAYQKGLKLLDLGCVFSEFGTRRRRSFQIQEDVVIGLIMANQHHSHENGGKLMGTSNVHLAMKYDLMPIGTIAHEWFMATAATYGYEGCNVRALRLWESVYPPGVGSVVHISLTDTFSTDVFLKDFKTAPDLYSRWRLRQDSGDPLDFIKKVRKFYDEVGIDPKDKPIVFSDSIRLDGATRIKKACDEYGLQPAFGIGTWLSNDFEKEDGSGPSKALNMVIKLAYLNDIPCVKISDDLEKNTGQIDAVKQVKDLLHISAETQGNANVYKAI